MGFFRRKRLPCSPMAVVEAQTATGIEVLTQKQLLDPVKASQLLDTMLGSASYEKTSAA